MPTTLTVKQVIQAELLKVCKEVNNRLREKQGKKKKPQFNAKEIARLRELTRGIGWDEAMTNKVMEAYSILHDAPELKEQDLPLDLFCVFVCEQNVNSHGYTLNVPYILCQVKEMRGLDLSGAISSVFGSRDQPRYATNDEVDYCIRNLNEKQLRVIMTHDIFKPIMEAAMNKAVMVEDAAPVEDNGDDHEIELANGRKITVSSE